MPSAGNHGGGRAFYVAADRPVAAVFRPGGGFRGSASASGSGNAGPSPSAGNRGPSWIFGPAGSGRAPGGDRGQRQPIRRRAAPPIQLPGTDAEPDAPKAPLPPENPFENALFIGDSRTVGICKYSGITEADFFASTGMSVYDVFKEQLEVGGQKARSLETLLRDQQYDRIYLMLGINELGYNFDKTVKTYGGVVDKLRELQPGAYIHIQANLHVTKEKSDGDKLYNNTNINRLNEAISALADGETVFYLDVNPTFDDENGCLAADLTWDGVHLLGKYYSSWADWLRENTPA